MSRALESPSLREGMTANDVKISKKKNPYQRHKELKEAKRKKVEEETRQALIDFEASLKDAPGGRSQSFVSGGKVVVDGRTGSSSYAFGGATYDNETARKSEKSFRERRDREGGYRSTSSSSSSSSSTGLKKGRKTGQKSEMASLMDEIRVRQQEADRQQQIREQFERVAPPHTSPTPHFFGSPQFSGSNLPPRIIGRSPSLIPIQLPISGERREIIDVLARCVVHGGSRFEKLFLDKAGDSLRFSFVLSEGTRENLYFRWRIFSLLSGDTLDKWSTEPFSLFADGPKYIPPEVVSSPASSHPLVTSLPFIKNILRKVEKTSFVKTLGGSEGGDSGASGAKKENGLPVPPKRVARPSIAERFEKYPYKTLSPEVLEEVKKSLFSLAPTTLAIADFTCLALGNLESSTQVAALLTANATKANGHPLDKLSALYAMSDILYNSSQVTSGHLYRSLFEEVIPDIFESMGRTHGAIKGRISKQALKDRIAQVLKAWREWLLFEPVFITGLWQSFLQESIYESKLQQLKRSELNLAPAPASRPLVKAPLPVPLASPLAAFSLPLATASSPPSAASSSASTPPTSSASLPKSSSVSSTPASSSPSSPAPTLPFVPTQPKVSTTKPRGKWEGDDDDEEDKETQEREVIVPSQSLSPPGTSHPQSDSRSSTSLSTPSLPISFSTAPSITAPTFSQLHPNPPPLPQSSSTESTAGVAPAPSPPTPTPTPPVMSLSREALRKIEVKVQEREAELEDQSVSPGEIASRVDRYRKELTASYTEEALSQSSEGDRGKNKERDRDRDSDRARSGRRERDSRERGGSSSRDRDRDRGRDREWDRDRDRERYRDRSDRDVERRRGRDAKRPREGSDERRNDEKRQRR
eukprot:TRINITY_DN7102_c0_g1_i1.p1 TRINITY_DN7102_c0_g1~~TRINITY_DN7102_c0_g1_i1.p1  ORF type:complete len:871 (+),score=207.94 TRINITY_DN7102_c0_g1_i1:179-2791(+)